MEKANGGVVQGVENSKRSGKIIEFFGGGCVYSSYKDNISFGGKRLTSGVKN